MSVRTLFATLALLSLPFTVCALTPEQLSLIEQARQRLVALQYQLSLVSSQQTSGTQCALPTRNLSIGMRGEDVRGLQQFLIKERMLSGDSATGYFGKLTEAAVKRWQAAQGIARSGSGWGVVGPRTRAALQSACSKATIGGTPVYSTPTFAPPAALTPVAAPASIFISSPGSGAVVRAGGNLPISWNAVNAPQGSKVSLHLLDDRGSDVGEIASGLNASGALNWSLPVEKSDCLEGTNAFACILNLAGCPTGICSLVPGSYAILARLGNSMSTTSPLFSITGSGSSALIQALYAPTSTYDAPSSSDQYGGVNSPLACSHQGTTYAQGSVITVTCEAGHCPSGAGYITGECKAAQWCIPFTSNCAATFAGINVSAYQGGGAAPISSGHSASCPQLGWRAYITCTMGSCSTGWNICTASGWILDPIQTP